MSYPHFDVQVIEASMYSLRYRFSNRPWSGGRDGPGRKAIECSSFEAMPSNYSLIVSIKPFDAGLLTLYRTRSLTGPGRGVGMGLGHPKDQPQVWALGQRRTWRPSCVWIP